MTQNYPTRYLLGKEAKTYELGPIEEGNDYDEEQGNTLAKKTLMDDTPLSTAFNFKQFMKFFGPGFLVSIACVDPGNLAGDIALAQQTGLRMIWLLVLSHFLFYLYQDCALQLGCGTRIDLATMCKRGYSKRVAVILWLMAELALIGSDTQEVLGTAIGLKILLGIDLIYGVILSVIIAFVSRKFYFLRKISMSYGGDSFTLN